MNSFVLTHKYTVEGYITFLVSIVNGAFSGESDFCISTKVLNEGILKLQRMYSLLQGSCTFNDYDSDDFIFIEMKEHGKVIISGQVGGSHRSQYLKYEIQTDQTELKEIIDKFNGVKNYD